MPLFKIDIEKQMLGEFWTNRYVVQHPSLQDAYTDSSFFVNLEIAVHLAQVDFVKVRVSDFVQNNDQFIIAPINLPGARVAAGDRLPLFNVVRCDFGAGFGSPSRKYLRGILVEGDTAFNDLTNGLISFMTTNYVQPLVNHTAFVDVDGERFNIGSVYPLVAMRQLRRGSRRRRNPIL